MRASSTLRGALPARKPGQADLAGDLAERLVDVAVELVLVDGDRQLHELLVGCVLGGVDGFDGAPHREPMLPVRLPATGTRCPAMERMMYAVLQAGRRHRPQWAVTTWKPHALAKPHADQLDLRIGDKVGTRSSCRAPSSAPWAR